MTLDKVNQLERELNKIIQDKLTGKINCKLLNPHKGQHFINSSEKEKRKTLLKEEDIKIIESLAFQAVGEALK